MNLSVLIIDDKKDENKIYPLLNTIPNAILTIDYCDKFTDADKKYQTKYYHLIVINISNFIEESLHFLKNKVKNNSKIIILSNSENHALKFLKCNISDYILLPIDTGEFMISLIKTIYTIQQKSNTLENVRPVNNYQNFITITSTKKIELIKTKKIVHFEADGRYTIVHLDNGTTKMATRNLGEFQKILNPEIFCRIHHKYIISIDKLMNVIKSDGCYCEMENNKIVPVSKRKLDDLNKILNVNQALIP
ncbi:LytTR family transcriptional regulator DNA-binding domain-containing protein [Flavobacterium ovatum]|uniref:LytR/AlgR family response regulator transcription factor n=1 Tax=Flavobacterium ovatum TaxID=1928857 RepID=UPI00344C4A5D